MGLEMFVNIGFGNMINSARVIAVVSPETSPIKRLVQDAKDGGRAIDVTCGRRTRAVILTDSDHVILSAIQCETIANRLSGTNNFEQFDDNADNKSNINNISEVE
jgi:regulator of extracellular matrix RemA (YlzA/DUF370 family)